MTATTEPNEDGRSDEDAMVAEALDRWRSTICLALGLPEMGSLEQVEAALAVLKTSAAVDVVGMQHRLDAAVGRERQALARAEVAERESAQLRIRADQVPTLEADLVKAHERAEGLAAELQQVQADYRWALQGGTKAVGEVAKAAQAQIDVLKAEAERLRTMGQEESLRLTVAEREVKRLTAHLEIADEQIEAVRKMEQASYQQLEARHLEEIERLRAQVCALAEDRDRAVKLALDCAPAAEVPAGWPEGWTLDAMSRLPCWRAPRDSDGHSGPSAVVYEVTGGGYEATMEMPYQDTVEGVLELLRRMAWGLAGRPLPEPALTAEEAAQVLAESAARMSQIRSRRDDWDEPATLLSDLMAIYRPWKGTAEDLAGQLTALEPDELERVRVAFGVPVCRDVVGRLLAVIARVAP